MTRVVRVVEPRLAGDDPVARIAVQAWGEALRDPDLGRFVSDMVGTIQDHFTAIARRAQQAGDLPAGTDPRAVGTALMALVPGYLMQRVLTGRPDADTYLSGLRALLPAAGQP
jgi:hypothetical protein